MPTEDINRNWEAESANANGNEPTTKDLKAEKSRKPLVRRFRAV